MHTLFQDVRYAVRQLLTSPGFALIAVISLALGIGATTAVFSVIYAALIHPYPFTQADRIMRLTVRDEVGNQRSTSLSSPQIEQLRQSPAVDSLVAMDSWSMTMTGRELPEDVNALFLTPNGFNFLGVPARRGRGLVPVMLSREGARSRWPCSVTNSGDGTSTRILAYWGRPCSLNIRTTRLLG